MVVGCFQGDSQRSSSSSSRSHTAVRSDAPGRHNLRRQQQQAAKRCCWGAFTSGSSLGCCRRLWTPCVKNPVQSPSGCLTLSRAPALWQLLQLWQQPGREGGRKSERRTQSGLHHSTYYSGKGCATVVFAVKWALSHCDPTVTCVCPKGLGLKAFRGPCGSALTSYHVML